MTVQNWNAQPASSPAAILLGPLTAVATRVLRASFCRQRLEEIFIDGFGVSQPAAISSTSDQGPSVPLCP